MNSHQYSMRLPAICMCAGVVLLQWDCAPLRAGEYDPLPPVPPGYQIIEGDILIPLPPPGSHLPKGVYIPTATDYWPNGVVPYEFDSNVTASNRLLMLDAMREWQVVAEIWFVPRDSEYDHLHIQNSTENNSAVGRQGGEQVVNIVSWGSRFVMAHELAHALGFWHEQSRSDRDTYVNIVTANIESGMGHNFDRHDEGKHYGPYDFDSVMHYGQCAFSTCGTCNVFTPACWTIEVRAPWDTQWQSNIGQRDHFSVWDRRIMSFLYPESDWRFVNCLVSDSGNGTFLSPYKYLSEAEAALSSVGHVFLLRAGTYAAGGLHSKAMLIQAPLGGALLKN